jgi:preprotein translocase subunit SecF
MFNIIDPETRIDFVAKQSQFAIVSGVVLALCLLAIFVYPGPSYGTDFSGGTELIVKFSKSLDSGEVRDIAEKAGIEPEQVQRYGEKSANEFSIKTTKISVIDRKDLPEDASKEEREGTITAAQVVEAVKQHATIDEWNWARANPNRLDLTFAKDQNIDTDTIVGTIQESVGLNEVEMRTRTAGSTRRYVLEFQGLQSRIEQGLKEAAPDAFNPDAEGSVAGIQRLETVGPRAGDQLWNSGIFSILVALFCILVYVAFRFDLRYAPGAVGALAHDITIAIGFFTFVQLEITLPIIAAFLTIIGYSLNDTIVVFDRIRENLEAGGAADLAAIANESINETLSRTVNTSLTTLLAVTSLAWLGGGLIQNFGIALIVGVIVGTYSSVFVATPLMLKMDEVLKD